MPTQITAEQKQELLRRLELARAAKAAKQAEKSEAVAAPKSKSAKSATSKASKASIPTLAPPQPVQEPEPTSQLAAPPVQEAVPSSATTKELEVASSKTAMEISSSSQQPETPSKGKKKVCLPVESDSDSEEEEKPKKKRGRKPYATIVLHREPKKSIDKVINRLSRIESSDSESSEDEAEPHKPSEPVPIPAARNTRPVPKQTQSIHNQDTARREMLKKLAMEYYG